MVKYSVVKELGDYIIALNGGVVKGEFLSCAVFIISYKQKGQHLAMCMVLPF